MGVCGDDDDITQGLNILDDHLLEVSIKGGKPINNPLWRRVLEAQAKRRWLGTWNQRVNYSCNDVIGVSKGMKMIHNKGYNKPSSSSSKRGSFYPSMKRRTRARGARGRSSRRNNCMMEKKVKTLKKLIPNGESSMGLDGLFRETADYILSLQVRVRVMQFMVDALSAGSEF